MTQLFAQFSLTSSLNCRQRGNIMLERLTISDWRRALWRSWTRKLRLNAWTMWSELTLISKFSSVLLSRSKFLMTASKNDWELSCHLRRFPTKLCAQLQIESKSLTFPTRDRCFAGNSKRWKNRGHANSTKTNTSKVFMLTQCSRIPSWGVIRNSWKFANICHKSSTVSTLDLQLIPTMRESLHLAALKRLKIQFNTQRWISSIRWQSHKTAAPGQQNTPTSITSWQKTLRHCSMWTLVRLLFRYQQTVMIIYRNLDLIYVPATQFTCSTSHV